MSDSMLTPAFDAPVDAAQKVFRHALSAMSEPGTCHDIGAAPALAPLCAASYALCLTLFDSETAVWLAPTFDNPVVRANLAFHCGCPVVATPGQAAFALLTPDDLGRLSDFRVGTDRDPHTSCTAIVQLNSLDDGRATTWQGPGILDNRSMRLPLPAAFWAQRSAQAFPRGLDYFFTAGRQLAALPRSTRVLHTIQETSTCT
ncbi:phosphonate C-P lyase system protein PhnH [Allopusillimonas ginsengisoli]|uniref:phosphonate C-P lyase system protein PhnH n=1 Tax=Allopusillimonas ginsengisoli TaxID=453575 RepID=UPI00102084B4|nr:phosphonate C-P lyase system protein PhnH [Allopusillimonas ginsengisoli]TEA77278.1 phosphonate C-P lyase system protein PhnH [Allopusillimonas ginsengisoli]